MVRSSNKGMDNEKEMHRKPINMTFLEELKDDYSNLNIIRYIGHV
jgi:hypothetical protein